MNTIFFALWFFLPAGIANMMPVIAMKIPGLNRLNFPIDFRKSFGGVRIFGDHKTIRGLVVGVLSGIIIAYLQYIAFQNNEWVRSFIQSDYMKTNPIIFGFLISFGALMGDSVKSFFKRRVGIASGKSWFPFDQIDYILGGILLSLLWVRLSVGVYVFIFFLWFILHIISTTIGYLIGLKDTAL